MYILLEIGGRQTVLLALLCLIVDKCLAELCFPATINMPGKGLEKGLERRKAVNIEQMSIMDTLDR